MDKKNNSGYCNSGDYNSGDYNSGGRNSGDHNSGYRNSGNRNSGGCNSGGYNSGNRNSGDYNSGDYNSGYFNTNEPPVRLFNKDSGILRKNIHLPYIDLKVTEWIPESQMTDQQKKDDPNFFVKTGTLITRTYLEAWALYWKDASGEDRQMFLDLPGFDATIFKEITGIDVQIAETPSCEGKVVEIDGKKYTLKEIK